jgi:PAS domain S-box-containing protein
MTRGLKPWFRKIFPHALIVILVSTGLWVESTHERQIEQASLDRMSSITATLASNGFSQSTTKNDLVSILESNGIKEYELAFISKNEVDEQFIKVLSSDPLYQSDEPFRDTESWLNDNYAEAGSEVRTFEGGVTKTITYGPVLEQGKVKGVYRLSSGPHEEKGWNWKGLWPWLVGIVLFSIQYFSRKSSGDSEKNTFTIDKKMALDSELRKKDLELRMLSLVAKKSQNLMLITDAKGVILWVNETYENRNNYSAEELNNFVGRHLPEVSMNAHIRTIIRNVVDFKKSVVYESTCKGENGKIHYAMTTVTPVADENGNVHKLLFVDTDITKLKVIEKENEAFKRFAELSTSPILRVNREGKVTFQNDASKKLLTDWCESPGILNERMCTLVQGILDSCESYSFEHSSQGGHFVVRFHPDCEDQTIHVIAEPIIESNVIDTISEDEDDRLVG